MIKKILFYFLLFSITYINAQHLAIDKIDEFTENRIIKVNASSGKKWKMSDDVAEGLMKSLFISTKHERTNKEYLTNLNFDITIGSTICATNTDGKSIILLKDKTKVELKQVSKIDCNQRIVIQYFLSLEDLAILSEKIISKIRIYATDGYIDLTIKEKKENLIKEHFGLILNKIQSYK
ncbi:hypothetical protein [uncultured Maribacter sp.]|uniref:hypothetical protein n=1 Tax=uncultured Maribacter sp. TaxID=431308 RepID=UPI002623D087|nr:hypothetical protein [uncultured Maribacter sp.]